VGIFSLKPDPIMGIDISSTAVKLLELSRTGKGAASYRVESYAMEPLPEKVVEDKNITEEGVEVVGDAIQRAIRRAKPHAQFAAVAVAGPAVMTKTLSMPGGLTDDEMLAAIQVDAEQHIPYPLEEVNLDFEVLGPNEKEPDRVDVLLAACRQENVDSRIAALEIAGLKAKVVDIERYALENALQLVVENDPEIGPEETVALIEIGATSSTMNVLGGGKIIFTREEMFGGHRLTEEIHHRYGLSYEEANLAKRNGGLPDDYETELLEPFKMEMAQQIGRMIQVYYATSTYGKLSHILVAGGCASIPGIIEHINSRVAGHINIANPFAAMSVASRVSKKALMSDAPALMIACGLALRSFDARR
jgi:type IV pilus assembly protein PilM